MKKFNPDFLRTNSASGARAQCSPCVNAGNGWAAKRSSVLSSIANSHFIPRELIAICYFQFQYGLRISELLNIKPSDIDPSGLVYIRGLKGSSDKFLQVSYLLDVFLSFRSRSKPLSYYYSRFFMYRLYKKLGISLIKDGHKNKAVTHAGRHMLAELTATYSPDFGGVADVLGHKSDSSALYYISGYTYGYDEEGNIIKYPIWNKKKSAIVKRGIMSNNIPSNNSNIYTDKNGRIMLKK